MKSKEDLLDIARLNYPVGTKYFCLNHNKWTIRCGNPLRVFSEKKNFKKKYFITDGCGGIIYDTGTWAEISNKELDDARKIIYAD